MIETFIILLQVLFIGLKLTNKINWSWWLVLLPLILYCILYFFVLVLIGGFFIGMVTALFAYF